MTLGMFRSTELGRDSYSSASDASLSSDVGAAFDGIATGKGVTKVTSGYWRSFDSQCGYTAISRRALVAIDGRMFARYGYPNDILARLRAVGACVADVTVRPVYDGQPSGIRLRTVVYPILFVLLRSMARRLWRQRVRPLLSAGSRAEARQLTDADRPADHFLPAPPP